VFCLVSDFEADMSFQSPLQQQYYFVCTQFHIFVDFLGVLWMKSAVNILNGIADLFRIGEEGTWRRRCWSWSYNQMRWLWNWIGIIPRGILTCYNCIPALIEFWLGKKVSRLVISIRNRNQINFPIFFASSAVPLFFGMRFPSPFGAVDFLKKRTWTKVSSGSIGFTLWKASIGKSSKWSFSTSGVASNNCFSHLLFFIYISFLLMSSFSNFLFLSARAAIYFSCRISRCKSELNILARCWGSKLILAVFSTISPSIMWQSNTEIWWVRNHIKLYTAINPQWGTNKHTKMKKQQQQQGQRGSRSTEPIRKNNASNSDT